MLKEASQRGLIYVDDGSSHRSLVGQIASANNLSFAKAEIVIDATPTPPHIDRALAKLETLAKERGIAVGVASALPASIDRIAAWAKAAENRGIVLVPISAVAAKPNQSCARPGLTILPAACFLPACPKNPRSLRSPRKPASKTCPIVPAPGCA